MYIYALVCYQRGVAMPEIMILMVFSPADLASCSFIFAKLVSLSGRVTPQILKLSLNPLYSDQRFLCSSKILINGIGS